MMNNLQYGSDLIVDIIKQHGIEYVACNPGATIRGLHDSIVNYNCNHSPELILCCHEEIAVAIAHGYAKASNKYMAVLLHSNVGLQHASMAIFNAWCDRVPLLVINGIGPLDTSKRRAWIDWIHTSNNQASIVRDYVKWYDQPYNLSSVSESLYRACKITNTEPKAPVYVAIDTSVQEDAIDDKINLLDISKYSPAASASANPEALQHVAELLVNAEFPIIIVDYLGRNPEAVQQLIKLAELLSIPVIDGIERYNFPTDHPLYLSGAGEEFFSNADVILSLDVNDLAGVLGPNPLNKAVKIININLADYLISSWAADYQKLYPIDIAIAADTSVMLPELYKLCNQLLGNTNQDKYIAKFNYINQQQIALRATWRDSALEVVSILNAIWDEIKQEDWILTNYGNIHIAAWLKKLWVFNKENCYLGGSGGAGLGYGLGASIGAALVYRDTNKICIDIQSDGDLLFTPSALWTAAHYKVPLLIIVMNNRSYGNTKKHSCKIA
ncbi:MAG: thiamine pyrophosphate-binding protein, partial [Gammaproteobacteria bacterium]|nr:thiamine pyrophosphate-binding protein [Gammaproteobacteria bacterium]